MVCKNQPSTTVRSEINITRLSVKQSTALYMRIITFALLINTRRYSKGRKLFRKNRDENNDYEIINRWLHIKREIIDP